MGGCFSELLAGGYRIRCPLEDEVRHLWNTSCMPDPYWGFEAHYETEIFYFSSLIMKKLSLREMNHLTCGALSSIFFSSTTLRVLHGNSLTQKFGMDKQFCDAVSMILFAKGREKNLGTQRPVQRSLLRTVPSPHVSLLKHAALLTGEMGQHLPMVEERGEGREH